MTKYLKIWMRNIHEIFKLSNEYSRPSKTYKWIFNKIFKSWHEYSYLINEFKKHTLLNFKNTKYNWFPEYFTPTNYKRHKPDNNWIICRRIPHCKRRFNCGVLCSAHFMLFCAQRHVHHKKQWYRTSALRIHECENWSNLSLHEYLVLQYHVRLLQLRFLYKAL